jgi:hypothetical protein
MIYLKITLFILLLILLVIGYQLISNLFFKNENKYITTIPYTNININFEYVMLALAGVGLLQSIILIVYLFLKSATINNKILYSSIFLILLSIGINSYLIYNYTEIVKGDVSFDDIQKKIFDDLKIKIFIPISIGAFIILSVIGLLLI